MIVIVESLLFCKLFEGVIDALPFLVLLAPLALYPLEFVLIRMQLLLFLMMMRRVSWQGLCVHPYFCLLPVLWFVSRAVFVLHFDELVHLLLVEILTERALPLRDLYLQTFGPLGVLIVQPGHSFLSGLLLVLPLQQFLPSAVPACL